MCIGGCTEVAEEAERGQETQEDIQSRCNDGNLEADERLRGCVTITFWDKMWLKETELGGKDLPCCVY